MKAFQGRMNRAWYWLGIGAVAVIYLVLILIEARQVPISEVALVFLCVPRLHDIGKSGWLVLIGLAVELLGLIIGFSFFSLEDAQGVIGLAGLLIAGLLAWLGAIPGDPKPNAWGEPPAPGLQIRRAGGTTA